MGSDITLLIVDPEVGTVVVAAWVGMGATRDRLREVARAPDFARTGWACWGSITALEALDVIAQRYAAGPTTDQVQRWLEQYPPTRYWWMFEHDY